MIFAAGRLGGSKRDIPTKYRQATDVTITEFLADTSRSHPLGFYSWNDALAMIYRQDRLLQTELEGKHAIAAILRCMRENPAAATTYSTYLELIASLTNPPTSGGMPVLDAPNRNGDGIHKRGVYLFPSSRSHEGDLSARLFGNQPVPEGFKLGDAMLRSVRSEEVRLALTRQSGWYDRQTWALEPFVLLERMPEGKRLRCDDEYRHQLDEVFKGILALTRETHPIFRISQLHFLRIVFWVQLSSRSPRREGAAA